MVCPITLTKFVGTVSLGLLTGLSYSSANITIPSLQHLPTSSTAARCLDEIKRLSRKHALRLANIANGCVLIAFFVSPAHRKHPYLLWVSMVSTLGSYGVDFWFHRDIGLKEWFLSLVRDTQLLPSGCLPAKTTSPKKEDDIVVVEAEDKVNGESVQKEMEKERLLQRTRSWLTGTALAMAIVGLWGDRF